MKPSVEKNSTSVPKKRSVAVASRPTPVVTWTVSEGDNAPADRAIREVIVGAHAPRPGSMPRIFVRDARIRSRLVDDARVRVLNDRRHGEAKRTETPDVKERSKGARHADDRDTHQRAWSMIVQVAKRSDDGRCDRRDGVQCAVAEAARRALPRRANADDRGAVQRSTAAGGLLGRGDEGRKVAEGGRFLARRGGGRKDARRHRHDHADGR